MKIHILYPFVDGPWGGANQFLKAVREYFIKLDMYTADKNEADIILFNSSPMALVDSLNSIKNLKIKYPNKIFINRIDGPVFYIRDRNVYIDKAFYHFNTLFCDGTIFQSNWSKDKNYFLGMDKNSFETTILNAPNPEIFNKDDKVAFNTNRKIKLIATSWSANMKKGFETYAWLDKNLDFDRFEFTFVGNSPIEFKNIIHKQPMDSNALVKELKLHDIFITASQSDPCSNSLIEALHCGSVAIGLNDGGHTEIIGKGGEVFNTNDEILDKLDKIVKNYKKYQDSINLPTIDEVGKKYYVFCKNIHNEQQSGNYTVKKFNLLKYLRIKYNIITWKIIDTIFLLKQKVSR